MNQYPKLRFLKYDSDWKMRKISSVLTRVVKPVTIKPNEIYCEIGIRSHGKGLFYKDGISGKSLGNKRVFWIEPNTFIVNIVFAWEQAIARTSLKEIGMIASHRFPMYKPTKENDLGFIFYYFLTKRGKELLGLASPGGAGRNKTLGQKNFDELQLSLPIKEEQISIASFLSLIDAKIDKQSAKVDALEEYKKGLLKKIFSQEIRFKDDDGNDYPEWEEKKLEEITDCLDSKRIPINEHSRAIRCGKIPYYGANGVQGYIDDYIFDEPIVLLAEDGGRFDDYKIKKIAQFVTGKSWVNNHAHVLRAHGDSMYLYCTLVHKDIRCFINGTSRSKLNQADMNKIIIPYPSLSEQKKISDFMSCVQVKSDKEKTIHNLLCEYKQGLLQQMFV